MFAEEMLFVLDGMREYFIVAGKSEDYKSPFFYFLIAEYGLL